MQKQKMETTHTEAEWEKLDRLHEQGKHLTKKEWIAKRRKKRIKEDILAGLEATKEGIKKYGPKVLKLANEVGKRAYRANQYGSMFDDR